MKRDAVMDKKIAKAIKRFGGSPSDLWAFSVTGDFIRFNGAIIHIERTGLGRINVGKGSKRIPVHSINAVQIKPPGHLVNGYMQLTLSGGTELRSQFGRQTYEATADENSVMIQDRRDLVYFEAIRDAIEAVISARFASVAPSPPPAAAQESTDIVGELERLTALKTAGALTEDEFQALKAKLLE